MKGGVYRMLTLHCLNGFNENANIQNRYQSLQDYLLGQAHGKR